jgi:glycosyltransferase involved in cell wall biosynthesis
MKALALFLRLGSRPIPRVIRMMHVMRDLGAECVFVGAFRNAGLPAVDEWDGLPVRRVGRVFPLVNGTRPMTYLGGVMAYWWGALRLLIDQRPAVIHASDFEAAVPSFIAARWLGVPWIYNIHDNLSVRYAIPAWARAILNTFESLLVLGSSVTLVPEGFRRELLFPWARSKVRVVRNSPADPGYRAPNLPLRQPLRVLFAGWLDFDRGLREIVSLAGAGKIQLVVAGEGDERVQRLLAETPNVDYRGFCDHNTIMQLTADCDAVAAFYNPRRIINKFAASNKIAEALAIGRPVLINDELMVAPGLMRAGAAIAVPYGAIGEVPSLMIERYGTAAAYEKACVDARTLYESDYHAEQVRRSSLDALAEAGILPRIAAG